MGRMLDRLHDARLAQVPRLRELHRDLLSSLGLPVAGQFSLDGLREAWLRDKKYRGSIRFVVLNGLGQPVTGVPAAEASLLGVLDDLAA